jgi:hypothetical protein
VCGNGGNEVRVWLLNLAPGPGVGYQLTIHFQDDNTLQAGDASSLVVRACRPDVQVTNDILEITSSAV